MPTVPLNHQVALLTGRVWGPVSGAPGRPFCSSVGFLAFFDHRISRLISIAAVLCALVRVGPAVAQQASSPSPAQPTVTQTDAASPAEPPADPSDDGPESMLPHSKDTRFWLSGQANFIFQTHPDFRALYSGQHSLGPHYEKATSRVLTLYTGVRLNNSTEILVNVEEAGGAAL